SPTVRSTIPSDSGIGTDNNSTSDQTEKGPAFSDAGNSFDLCGFEAAEACCPGSVQTGAAKHAVNGKQEKKQKHNRRKRKCLQSRDHLHFLSELEEVVVKLQQLRVSHRRYTCYPSTHIPLYSASTSTITTLIPTTPTPATPARTSAGVLI
ncbi:hypothetical protein KUCAC02_028699, partial [Chaenocephalus aceratus]